MSEQEAEARLAAVEAKLDTLAGALGDGELFSGDVFARLTSRFEAATMLGIRKKVSGREGRVIMRLLGNDTWSRRFVVAEAVARAEAASDTDTDVLAGDGIAFLQWIIDNWDTIYEIIQMVMALFAT